MALASISETSRTHGRMRSPAFNSCSNTGRQSIVESCTSRLRAVTLSRTSCSSAAGSARSPTRMPRRAILSSYAGPMPRDVVPIFRQKIQIAVIRKNEMRLVTDDDAVVDVDAVSGQLVDLGEQRLRIDDDA